MHLVLGLYKCCDKHIYTVILNMIVVTAGLHWPTLVKVIVLSRRAVSHFLNQRCGTCVKPYGKLRPQWINLSNTFVSKVMHNPQLATSGRKGDPSFPRVMQTREICTCGSFSCTPCMILSHTRPYAPQTGMPQGYIVTLIEWVLFWNGTNAWRSPFDSSAMLLIKQWKNDF